MPWSIGMRFNPMSLAPTQMEQATCGNQVSGLLMNTVASSTGRFKRKTMPSTRHKVRCSGSRGVGGTNAISRPNENALMTRLRLNAQQPRSTTSAVKCLRYHRFSSAWRAGVMLLSQCCMNLRSTPEADIIPLPPIRGDPHAPAAKNSDVVGRWRYLRRRCSIAAVAIILERLWTLQSSRVIPRDLSQKVWNWFEADQLSEKLIVALEQNSPLGKLLAIR